MLHLMRFLKGAARTRVQLIIERNEVVDFRATRSASAFFKLMVCVSNPITTTHALTVIPLVPAQVT